MKKNDEFYVGYLDSIGDNTKKKLKRFVGVSTLLIILGAFIFGFSQKPFKNSTFELTNTSKLTGIFHEDPYPMLRVEIAENTFKNVLLLGFGKSSANPYLSKIKSETNDLKNAEISIEGNLIYYNGKTLLQITDDEKISLIKDSTTNVIPSNKILGDMSFQGEIIDPKCYFGVMKPGKGKIHRSCAVRCISGGIPPVLATSDNNDIATYFLLTDLNGNAINDAILPFIGKPAVLSGSVEKMEDWHILRIDTESIISMDKESSIY